MPLVRRIRNRGANIVVEAHGEVLFSATGDVGRWTNRFSQRARAFAAQEAPTNKRPRWAHYGKPLKTTFTASTTYQPVRMRVYSAIGSTARHAYYVDQGTGIYAGNGPYKAKVLPPWQRGEPSLYEHTWRPGNSPRTVKPVMIKGQKGQGFFDAGLKRAFTNMRMRSYQTAGDPRITDALNSVPTGLENFAGNTIADSAFRAELAEWRAWRDEAWALNRSVGRDGSRKEKVVKPKKPKATKPPKKTPPPPPVKPTKAPPKTPPKPTKAEIMTQYVNAIKTERKALADQAKAKYTGKTVTVSGRKKHNGVYAYEVTVSYGGKSFVFWVTSDYQAAI